MYIKKSELQNFINALCQNVYANQPEVKKALKKAFFEILPKTPEYLAQHHFMDFAAKISDLAGDYAYEIDPKIVKEDLKSIWFDLANNQGIMNESYLETSTINAMIVNIYTQYKHFNNLNKEKLLSDLKSSGELLSHMDFILLIASVQSKAERKCLQDNWAKLKSQCSRGPLGVQLKKDEIAKMIDLHLAGHVAHVREGLKKLFYDIVFLDSLNINEFDEFLTRAYQFKSELMCFEEQRILLAEWRHLLQNKLQLQQEIPVSPGQDGAPPPYDEAMEMKIHVESFNSVSQSVPPIIQAPVGQLSLDDLLQSLEEAINTPEELQRAYDRLLRVKQKQQLVCMHNDYEEMKLAAEQPSATYSVSSSSPAYTPSASSIHAPENNGHIPLEAQPEAIMPLPSAPPLWALES